MPLYSKRSNFENHHWHEISTSFFFLYLRIDGKRNALQGYLAIAHDEQDILQNSNILQRISRHQDEIGVESICYPASSILNLQ